MRLTAEGRAEIRSLVDGGVPRGEVARRFGIHPDSVTRLLRGTRPGRSPRLGAGEVEWAVALLGEGCPIGEVARSLGVSREVVRNATGWVSDFGAAIEVRELVKRFEALVGVKGGVS